MQKSRVRDSAADAAGVKWTSEVDQKRPGWREGLGSSHSHVHFKVWTVLYALFKELKHISIKN